MKKHRQVLIGCKVLCNSWDPWTAKQHHWKSEAKEGHQLTPGGPSNRQKSSGPNPLK